MREPEIREYSRDTAVVFRKTGEQFGGLSNMAPGYPLCVGTTTARTLEALYQACRYPHRPDVQQTILAQASPMTAKMVAKPHRSQTRPDWPTIRVRVMRWGLRVKAAMHPETFGTLLLSTGKTAIVEESRQDDFWGAQPQPGGVLRGRNVLGRLLMELREELSIAQIDVVPPPAVDNFLLLGCPIGPVSASDNAKEQPDRRRLFD